MPTPRDPDAFDRLARITAADLRRQARHVAEDLLGSLLLVDSVRGPVGGLVVETEAYVNGLDPASHLAAGRTPRTESFFGGAGTVYVYTVHGHHLLNLVTTWNGYPEGVLVRALEPTHGRNAMRERRGVDAPGALTSGPGRLAEALGVATAAFDGRPLAETAVRLHRTDLDPAVAVSSRIGVSEAADWPLRFTVAQNEFVSKPVSADERLDHEAVERCYERLAAGTADGLALDR